MCEHAACAAPLGCHVRTAPHFTHMHISHPIQHPVSKYPLATHRHAHGMWHTRSSRTHSYTDTRAPTAEVPVHGTGGIIGGIIRGAHSRPRPYEADAMARLASSPGPPTRHRPSHHPRCSYHEPPPQTASSPPPSSSPPSSPSSPLPLAVLSEGRDEIGRNLPRSPAMRTQGARGAKEGAMRSQGARSRSQGAWSIKDR